VALSRHTYRGAVSADAGRRNAEKMMAARGLLRWTAQEDNIVRDTYPDYRAMRRKLQHRTYWALRNRVQSLGIAHQRNVWSTSQIRCLRRMRAEGSTARAIAATMCLTKDQVAQACCRYRIPYPRQPLKEVRNPLLNSIRRHPRGAQSGVAAAAAL
jgi:hypothetical protein